MAKLKTKSEKKISIFKILENNIFVLKIVWRLSKSRFILKLFMTIINSVIPTINIVITRNIIFLVESNSTKSIESFKKVLFMIFVLMGIQLIPNIFSVWNATLIEPIFASKINQSMNEVFIDKAKKFNYCDLENTDFYNKYTRALNQVDTITHSVFNMFFSICASIIGIISLSSLIISMDGIIILFALLGVLANFIQSLIMSKLNYKTNVILTPISRKQNYIKRLLYIPDYGKDIKCSDITATGKKYYTKSLRDIIGILKKYGLKVAVINTMITLFTISISAIMMIILFARVSWGIYKISDFTALSSSVTQLQNILNQFLNTTSSLYSNSMYIDDFKYIYNYKGNEFEKKEFIKFNVSNPSKIEVKNLYFSYPNSNKNTLSNMSFTIEPGEKVAVIGLNGSGKTTLLKLLLRLYEPDKGEIYINDNNIKEYKIEDIQNNIGAVFQDHHVYAYTIKENIAFEDELRKETYDTLKKLNLMEKISILPNALNTHLTKEFYDEGINFSGGEEQKICISRALNKKTGLYIFDEPTSALDQISKSKVNEIIFNLNSTVIFITHELSMAERADKILVLQNGMLMESGSHKSLLKTSGIYAKIFAEQHK